MANIVRLSRIGHSALYSLTARSARVAHLTTKPTVPTDNKIPKFDEDPGDRIATDAEQATGVEKIEHDAMLAGIDDPWNMKVPTLGIASRASPNIVKSMREERIMGCICSDDQTYVLWWMLKKGPPVRCQCGKWFQLQKGNPINIELP